MTDKPLSLARLLKLPPGTRFTDRTGTVWSVPPPGEWARSDHDTSLSLRLIHQDYRPLHELAEEVRA